MLLIDHLPVHGRAQDLPGRECDRLVLTSEQRRWVRGRRTTANGRDIGLALATGTVLAPGQILWVEPQWYLIVEAAPEPVLMVAPEDSKTAVRIAFEVGNRHFPLAMEEKTLLVPDDPAMVQLLDRMGARWERRSAVFEPIGHGHSHEHGNIELKH